MKQFVGKLLILSFLLPQLALAECDFKTGITRLESGDYLYKKQCHLKVGKVVKDLKDREEQVKELEKSIELKDLAIDVHKKRTDVWMDTTFKLEDRVNTIDKMRSINKVLYFGLGVLVTVGAGFAIGAAAR